MRAFRRTPATCLPGPEALVWLVYESPTFRTVFDEREGFAWAAEIADALWPDTPLIVPCPDLAGQTPVLFVADMLDEMVAAGLCQRGDDNSYRATRPEGERPWWLPSWPEEYSLLPYSYAEAR